MRLRALMEIRPETKTFMKNAYRSFKDHIDWSGGDAETLYQMYQDDSVRSDVLNDDGFPKSPRDFQLWMRDHVNYMVHDVLISMEHLLVNGKLPIWRMITAPPTWNPTVRNLGEFWAYDKGSADAHWGSTDKGHVYWLLQSEALPNQINWTTTVGIAAHPSQGPDEKEIRLRRGARIPLVGAWRQERTPEYPHGTWVQVSFPIGPYPA